MRRVSRAQYNAIMARRQQMANNGNLDTSQQGNISMEMVQEGEQPKANTVQSLNQANNASPYPSGRQIQYAQMRQQQAQLQRQQAQQQVQQQSQQQSQQQYHQK